MAVPTQSTIQRTPRRRARRHDKAVIFRYIHELSERHPELAPAIERPRPLRTAA